MNRLILIGNGFDLAHGLKTNYNEFMVWYLKYVFNEAMTKKSFEDDLIKITWKGGPANTLLTKLKTVDEFIDLFYKHSFVPIIENRQDLEIPPKFQHSLPNPFRVTIKSDLMKTLLRACSYYYWVDIENEFYEHLKKILNAKPETLKIRTKEVMLKSLNLTLKNLVEYLKKYLKGLSQPSKIQGYTKIFRSDICKDDIVTCEVEEDAPPENTLFLSFNYTDTLKRYLDKNNLKESISQINYIHGETSNENNPLIFGFGDELDEYYRLMELEKTKGFFEYIKSFWYFKTSNYHNLTRFIEGNDFQVFIMGHSCGLSDRTMLSMIFEHPNCKSIKIFYYDWKTGNNFGELTQEISRHFRNKAEMRKKIISFDKSEAMPQK